MVSCHIPVFFLGGGGVEFYSALPPLFVDIYGRSLWFCHLEFDKKKAISDDSMAHSRVFFSFFLKEGVNFAICDGKRCYFFDIFIANLSKLRYLTIQL